jgi:hypothetical protein
MGPLTADRAEPVVGVRVVRGEPVRVAATCVVRKVGPGPAPDAPARARRVIAPLPNITCHVIKSVAVRRKTTHRTRVWISAGSIRRVIPAFGADVITIRCRTHIVRIAVSDGVAPRKALAAQSAACGIFPFRRSWQTVPNDRNVAHYIGIFPGLVDNAAGRISGCSAFFLTASVTPLHAVVPAHRLHRMVCCFPRTGVVKAVSVH